MVERKRFLDFVPPVNLAGSVDAIAQDRPDVLHDMLC